MAVISLYALLQVDLVITVNYCEQMCEHGGTELLIVELFKFNRLFDIPDRS